MRHLAIALACAAGILVLVGSGCPAAEPPEPAGKTILFVGGAEGHPPGTHEALATLRLLKHCVETSENVKGVRTAFFESWPRGADREFDKILPEADCFVFCGDGFPIGTKTHRQDSGAQLARLDAAAKRGAGVVLLHFATGVDKGVKDHKLLEWTGGCYAPETSWHGYHSGANTITPAGAGHPVHRGWKEFKIKDELYLDYWFGEGGLEGAAKNGLTPIARSSYARKGEAAKDYVVAWAWQRTGAGAAAGRGFVTWASHWFANWKNEDMRRMTLNGIVWAAGLEVPEGGVASSLPEDLNVFGPKSARTGEQKAGK